MIYTKEDNSKSGKVMKKGRHCFDSSLAVIK